MRHLAVRYRAAGAAAALLALAAMSPGLAFAQEAPQLSRQQARAIYNACRDDIRRFCPNIRPGGGAVAACMRENAQNLSPSCTDALADVRSGQ